MTECEQCGREIPTGESVLARVSEGFGLANDRVFRLCGRACRARWHGDDVVLATTEQLTLGVWTDGLERGDPDAVALGVS